MQKPSSIWRGKSPKWLKTNEKEIMGSCQAEWRKVTLEDLLESGNEAESEKEEEVKEKVEIEKENRKDTELKEIPVEKETQPKEINDGQEEKQPIIAGIKQRKKHKKGKTKQEAPKSTGPSMNQPLWDELKNAPEDTRILQEMCEKNGKGKTHTPDTVTLTIKASEALLGTLPKKEKDPGSPLITATVGDVVIRNTLMDLGERFSANHELNNLSSHATYEDICFLLLNI
ncbi:hypothetical protein L2E82_44139 [Cichorium intybus]|uniref:Uncharacterized protein n=1 Tax=Cichorium intybus TaxID=13427 RepID=A0ACB8ZPX5_CICIN|nr:hypothetical protein L2E82_44139 [Cichorium intybus]